ncbi:MAG TPA: hypothetical protein VFL57_22645, partial [Bryobacteraceae bacterium]|nr:hypothetical protein [Bryobacteraceae bacterium]
NAFLYCILAGAMISVSSTAIGLLIGIPTPALSDVLPASLSWAVLTFLIGCLFTVLAILGFEKLSKFASVCAPWLFAMFVAAALAVLARLGVRADLSNLWDVLSTRVWDGVPTPGQERFSFWHVAFFAWFANLAMHVSLSDMALFRYAKHWSYGLYTAVGVYPGHFLAWICSGIMVAGVKRAMDPGLMAWEAAGIAGIAAVVLAGWTTANPTLYRAGLALQSITPNWPRWKITLAAGLTTSVLACFPVFFLKLLDYVALYGLSLMPVGAIVFAEHWILPWLGVEPYRAERTGAEFNWNAVIVWAGTLAACWFMPVHLFFRWLPGYFIALIAYTALESISARRGVRQPATASAVRS